MNEKEEYKKVLYSEWTITEPIKLDDICVLKSTEREFLCSKIIPDEQFEYLYFGSFDFNDILFAVQYMVNAKNFTKVLTEKAQQEYAYNLYKKTQGVS